MIGKSCDNTIQVNINMRAYQTNVELYDKWVKGQIRVSKQTKLHQLIGSVDQATSGASILQLFLTRYLDWYQSQK